MVSCECKARSAPSAQGRRGSAGLAGLGSRATISRARCGAVAIAAVAATGGFLFGFDSAVINGAVTTPSARVRWRWTSHARCRSALPAAGPVVRVAAGRPSGAQSDVRPRPRQSGAQDSPGRHRHRHRTRWPSRTGATRLPDCCSSLPSCSAHLRCARFRCLPLGRHAARRFGRAAAWR